MYAYSFGDGVQYPVQINHLPENVNHTSNSNSNYESMGSSVPLDKHDSVHNDDARDQPKINSEIVNENIKRTNVHDDMERVSLNLSNELTITNNVRHCNSNCNTAKDVLTV